MSDLAILRLTLKQKCVLITYDQDFGEIVFHQKAEHYGVLLLRLGIDTPRIHIRALENFLALHEPEEIEGEFWKVDERYL